MAPKLIAWRPDPQNQDDTDSQHQVLDEHRRQPETGFRKGPHSGCEHVMGPHSVSHESNGDSREDHEAVAKQTLAADALGVGNCEQRD